jgi:hypothetical protein
MEKRKDVRKILKISIFLVLTLVWGVTDISAAQASLDIPTGNLNVENAVSIDLLENIALAKSKETWGPGVLGDPVPLLDLNGDVVVYMFPYRIGADVFPDYNEILQEIKQGRELRDLLGKNMDKAREKYLIMDHGKTESQSDVAASDSKSLSMTQMPSVRPDGTPSRKGELQKIGKFASDKAMGAGKFGTILVSATTDRFPVLAYFHYLAPYYINFDIALEKAEQDIGQGAYLKSIYFLGLEGQFFEFVNDAGSTLLNSKTFETTTLDALKQSRNPQIQFPTDSSPLPEKAVKNMARIANEWEKLKSELGEK